jgi:Serine carboxypeptidase S28
MPVPPFTTFTHTHVSWLQSYAGMRFLSVNQTLANYALVIQHVSEQLREGDATAADHIPVIAYGSGYSGNLATWLRLRYPKIVTG